MATSSAKNAAVQDKASRVDTDGVVLDGLGHSRLVGGRHLGSLARLSVMPGANSLSSTRETPGDSMALRLSVTLAWVTDEATAQRPLHLNTRLRELERRAK